MLKTHLEVLGRKDLTGDLTATDEDGGELIVDLMLARSMEQARDRKEHLAVELERPTVKVGPDELTQIQEHALAVVDDERFAGAAVSWDFVVVSNELTDLARESSSQANSEPGLYWGRRTRRREFG